jgi:hypothetical protein
MSQTDQWNHLPQYYDPIPVEPTWAHWSENGRDYWATRIGEGRFGVASFPEQELALAFGPVIRRYQPRAGLYRIEPEGWQWHQAFEEHNVATVKEAWDVADDLRQEAVVKVMLAEL